MPMFEIVAAVTSAIGCYLIYVSWRNQSGLYSVLRWGALVMALPLWVTAQGAEYGIIYALSLPALFVWFGIWQEQKWQREKESLLKENTQWKWNGRKVFINFWLVLYMFPLLMIFSGIMTVSFIYLLPMTEVNQLAFGIILMPILWGVLSYWYFVSLKRYIPIIFSVTGTLLASAHLYG